MINWKTYKLGEVIDIKHGYAYKGEFFSAEPTIDILVTPGNFNIGGGFKAEKFKYYDGETPENYVLSPGDIIVTMTDLSKDGDTLGYSAIVPNIPTKRLHHNQRIGLLRFKRDDFSKRFIYWLMRTKAYQSFVLGTATGTTVKHTAPIRIQEYTFTAPDLPTQLRIAEILSALDDKIELNRRMNQTLEQMAQTLFRQYFVEGIDEENLPEGWQWGKLKEVSKNVRKSVTPAEMRSGIDYVGLEHIPRQSIALYDWATSEGVESNKYSFNEDQILFGKLRPYFHKVVLAPMQGVCSTDILVIEPLKEHMLSFCLLHYSSKEVVQYCTMLSSGTRMPRADWKGLAEYEIAIPPSEVLANFNEKIYPLLAKIKLNIRENKTLAQTRDTLLPKLISGEIDVRNASPTPA